MSKRLIINKNNDSQSFNQWQNPTVTTCAPIVIQSIKLDERFFTDSSSKSRTLGVSGEDYNTTFHYGRRIAELIEAAGCRLLYLPAYSPDLNRIEKCWAWIKSLIRKCLSDSTSLRQAMESVLKDAES